MRGESVFRQTYMAAMQKTGINAIFVFVSIFTVQMSVNGRIVNVKSVTIENALYTYVNVIMESTDEQVPMPGIRYQK